MSAASNTPARASTCRNCGAAVASNFCPDCGQDTSLHPLSVWEFVHELVSHYVAAEGKLWRTLALLTLRPGRLTVEYLAGRRQRYIVPLRLYLTASFIFFALAQVTGSLVQPDLASRAQETPAASSPAKAAPGKAADSADDEDAVVVLFAQPDQETLKSIADQHFEECLKPATRCSAIKRLIAPTMIKFKQDPKGIAERLSERFRHSLSYAMFLLLPIFALLLAAVYRKRKLYYGEHLVFALHVHSFWFFLAIVAVLLPESVGAWLPLGFTVYGFWALQRVYRGRWWATLLRGTTVMTLYAIVMGLGAAGLSLLLLATV